MVRKALTSVLQIVGLPKEGFSFHMFRRSGATLALDSEVALDYIKIHGGWRSDAVWSYLAKASVAPSKVAATFQSIVNK